MFRIQTLNNIAKVGLAQFAKERYQMVDGANDADAVLVRSANMHDMDIHDAVQVIGRAGAGTNNIPIDKMTEKGVLVLNTPGANANAVKELVLAGMLLASRHICDAWQHVRELTITDDDELHRHVEKQKKQYVGSELPGKTLGIIGLGYIGVQVANAADHLGMNVIGYDPAMTVKHAWQLSSDVEQAEHVDEVFRRADFLTVHVPLVEGTRHLVNEEKFQLMKPGAVVLNFSRDGIVDNEAVLAALEKKILRYYVSDFPHTVYQGHPQVISLPHLGASTAEAEQNCAVMVAQQVRAYLEEGNITNSVNFPTVKLPRINGDSFRLSVINANVPNMVAQISSVLSAADANIVDMINKSRGDVAYTLVDVNAPVSDKLLAQLSAIDGVMRARRI